MTIRLRSENVAGILAFTGSCLVILIGDVQSAIATALFVASNGFFIVRGHTRWGYSLAALALALGYGVLAGSAIMQSDPALTVTLWGLAAVWGLASLRWPLHCAGRERAGDALPPVVGVIVTIVRVPALLAAAAAGQWVLLAAMILWTVADLLAGRVQEACRLIWSRLGIKP